MSLSQSQIRTSPLAPLSRSAAVAWTRGGIVLAAILLWEIVARTSGNADLVAPPSAIVRAFYTTILPDADIRAAIGLVFLEVIVAYALAIAGGLLIGLAVGWTAGARRSAFPIVLLLYAIPQVILLPLFMLALGLGPTLKIVFGFTHGVFPIIVNVVSGMRNVNPLYLRAAEAMGARREDIVRDVVFPHMMASFFTGLRLAMTMTLLGVILAELYVSSAGIGYFIRLFTNNFDPAPLFALVSVMAAIAIGLNELVRIAERRLTRWQR